jgi:hypothetical protein
MLLLLLSDTLQLSLFLPPLITEDAEAGVETAQTPSEGVSPAENTAVELSEEAEVLIITHRGGEVAIKLEEIKKERARLRRW